MKKTALALFAWLLASVAVAAPIKPQETLLVVQLPAASTNVGKTYLVMDSLAGDCVTGGGELYVMCEATTGGWVARQMYGSGGSGLPGDPAPCEAGYVTDIAQAGTLTCTMGESVAINTANFVGTVTCAGKCPTSGTSTNARAVVTSLNGTTLSGGHLELAGTYNVATPHTTTDGFRVVGAHIFNDCNSETNGCGDNFTTFQNAAVTLARAYAQNATGFNPAGVRIKMHGGYWRYRGSTFRVNHNGVIVDAGGQQFICNEKQDITTALPNATITVATSPITINFASSVCGTGTCDSGDELVQSMDVVLLSGSGDWAETGRRVKIHRIASDGLSATLETPQTSDYSGAAVAATGAIWEFDTYNDGAFEPWGDSQFAGSPLIMAQGNCAPANPWVPNAKGSFREVPLKALVNRYGSATFDATIYNFAHKDDQSVVSAPINLLGGGTNDTFHFIGSVRASADNANGKYSIDGWDDTTNADDGIGCKYCIGTPMADIRPNAGGGLSGTALRATGANCQNLSMDFAHEEGARTLAWLPRGCGSADFYQIPAELHGGGCAAAGSGGNDCTDVAARRAVFEIGDWNLVSGTGTIEATYNIGRGERTYFGNAYRPFIRIAGTHTRLRANAYVEGADPILIVSDNGTAVSGILGCEGQNGASDCALPANGTYHELTVLDSVGAVTASGRLHRAVPNEFSAMSEVTSPAATDKALFERASDGAKIKVPFSSLGGSATNLDALSDVTLTTPGTGAVLIKSAGDWIDGQLDLADADAVTGVLGTANGGLGSGASNGTIPIGDGSGVPSFAAPTSDDATEITVTLGPGTIAIDVPTSPTFDGTVTAGALDSGECTIDTGLDCDAHATLGGTLGAKEGADDGTARYAIKVPDTGLTAASGDVGPTMQASGLLTATTLLHVVADDVLLGRVSGAAGAVEELTGTAATALLDVFTSGAKGLAPASGGGTTNYLRADGTWAAPPGGAASNSFVTIDTPAGTDPAAEITTDTLQLLVASGDPLTITGDNGADSVTFGFAVASEAQGDLLLRGATDWGRLADGGTAGVPLVAGGGGGDPSYATIGGAGITDGSLGPAELDVTGETYDFSGSTLQSYTALATHTQSGSPHTISAGEVKGALVCNTGASGAAVYNLPAAAAGMTITVCVSAAQDVDINPDTGDQILVLTNAAGDAISSDAAVGSIVTLVALDGTNWFPVGYRGTWTDVN